MFLNLLMLAGLGAVVLPLVVHLLARSRYRTVQWGAMMFLEGNDPREARSARLRQFTLLAMRMGMIGLLALALARPVLRGGWTSAALEAGQVTAVLVLDRTYSMAYDEGGRSRFDRAREAALHVLASLKPGDEVAVVLPGEQIEVLFPETTTNLQAAARAIAELEVSTGERELAGALARARAILDKPNRMGRELYILTDRQASSWASLEGEAGREALAWTSGGARRTQVHVIPIGGEAAENLVVESVGLVEAPAIRGMAAEVEVRVRNYGSTPQANVQVEIFLTAPSEGQREAEKSAAMRSGALTVAGRGAATVRIPVHFGESGSHVVSAQINSAGLREHSRFELAVDVIDPLEVLILSGEESGEALERESFYLRLALAPHASTGEKRADPAVVTVRPAEQLSRVDLRRYDVIVLANVPLLSQEEVRLIEQRVYDGAGLVICPGHLTRTESYNLELYREGQGLMPALLEASTPGDGSQATAVASFQEDGALLKSILRRGGSAAPNAVVLRYFPATPRAWEASVSGRYASGDAFVVEGPRGRGRVALVTTSLDADWGTLPLTSFYLPFVQSLVRLVGAPAGSSRNLLPGEALVASFDEAVIPESVVVTRGEERVGGVSYVALRNQVRATETSERGIYRVRAQTRRGERERVLHYVVQPARRDADLSPLADGRWSAMKTRLGFGELEPDANRLASALGRSRVGQELWTWLLAGVMGLAACELWLSRRWSSTGGEEAGQGGAS